MQRNVIKTKDGSNTIYLPEMDENYHSSHGALQEARHVFIDNGLKDIASNEIKIFEMGFGTGLNAILSVEFGLKHNKQITYHGIEAYPIESELIRDLNYEQYLPSELEATFIDLHNLKWDKELELTRTFFAKKIHSKIEDYTLRSAYYDIIYFDAFGPRAQSRMWKSDVLSKMYDGLKEGGVLVTYCAQGQFKRDLKMIGFEIQVLPGPPGKREMTRARKI